MRTAIEIYQKIQEEKPNDTFVFKVDALIGFCAFNEIKAELLDTTTEEKWKEVYKEPTRENVLEQTRDYMEFAWENVLNERGLSANRSVEKMEMFMWLLEDVEMVEFAKNDNNYAPYGAPILKKISEKYELPIPESQK